MLDFYRRTWRVQVLALVVFVLFAFRPFREEGVNALLGLALLPVMGYLLWRTGTTNRH